MMPKCTKNYKINTTSKKEKDAIQAALVKYFITGKECEKVKGPIWGTLLPGEVN